MISRLYELYKTDSKKFWAYASCIVLAFITLVFLAFLLIVIIIYSPDACKHEYSVIEQVEPTYDSDGKIVKKCDLCDHEMTETLDKLEYVTTKFSGFELTFGEYSFTEVDNRFSEHNKKQIVKIPVTVKNISKSPQSLNSFYYTLFGSNGTESEDVGYLLDDDIDESGEVLPGKSYTKYFHIVYDGDGVYTIVFDDLLLEKKTVEIEVKK